MPTEMHLANTLLRRFIACAVGALALLAAVPAGAQTPPALKLQLRGPTQAFVGMVAVYEVLEAQGIAINTTWVFDPQPKGTLPPPVSERQPPGPASSKAQGWHTPGTHVVRALAQTPDGRQASADLTVEVVGPPIAVTSGSTCALTQAGGVRCWGWNASGTVGINDYAPQKLPVNVGVIEPAVGVTLGGDFACALLAPGTAKCWGSNESGQLGTSLSLGSGVVWTPLAVQGFTEPLVGLSAFRYGACALARSGAVSCWGLNNLGQLGPQGVGKEMSATPVPIGLSDAVAIAAGSDGGETICALKRDRTVVCWGDNALGQLGIGSNAQGFSPTPQTVLVAANQPLRNVLALQGGASRFCAIVEGASLEMHCWGRMPGTGDRYFAGLQGPAAVRQISSGPWNDCMLAGPSARPSYTCRGDNGYGQALGNGQTSSGSTQPAPVQGINPAAVMAFAISGKHQCVLLNDGKAFCMGEGSDGQLGQGALQNALTPVQVQAGNVPFWGLPVPKTAPIAVRAAGAGSQVP